EGDGVDLAGADCREGGFGWWAGRGPRFVDGERMDVGAGLTEPLGQDLTCPGSGREEHAGAGDSRHLERREDAFRRGVAGDDVGAQTAGLEGGGCRLANGRDAAVESARILAGTLERLPEDLDPVRAGEDAPVVATTGKGFDRP